MYSMDWIREYQLFLFDFDGLLVNTEHIHHRAYLQLLESYGLKLGWSFADFCQICHPDAKGSSKAIGAQFPELVERIGWDKLYRKKGEYYRDLLRGGEVDLMPGAAELLEDLARAGTKRAVVTHSRPEDIALARKGHAVLDSILHWITRDQYTHAKPHPEAYLKALTLKGEGERAVGFEDSLRGVRALCASGADGVLVATADYPFLEEARKAGATHLTQLPILDLGKEEAVGRSSGCR